MRWRTVPSDSSRLATSACSASAVPIRSSTDGSSRRTSTGDVLGPQRVGDRRHHRVAQPRERFGGFLRQLRRGRAPGSGRARSPRAPGGGRRGWPAARPRRLVGDERRQQVERTSVPGSLRSAAPPRPDRVAPRRPPLRAMPSTMSRAASRFCAGPGAARNAAAPARIEKSWKSPSSSIWRSGSTPDSRGRDTAAPRSERRDPDRAASPGRGRRSSRRRRR